MAEQEDMQRGSDRSRQYSTASASTFNCVPGLLHLRGQSEREADLRLRARSSSQGRIISPRSPFRLAEQVGTADSWKGNGRTSICLRALHGRDCSRRSTSLAWAAIDAQQACTRPEILVRVYAQPRPPHKLQRAPVSLSSLPLKADHHQPMIAQNHRIVLLLLARPTPPSHVFKEILNDAIPRHGPFPPPG
jgi:hypothetical protein